MTVLIATQNKDVLLGFNKKLKFQESTKNTCIFNVSAKAFLILQQKAREAGYNPYALMTW